WSREPFRERDRSMYPKPQSQAWSKNDPEPEATLRLMGNEQPTDATAGVRHEAGPAGDGDPQRVEIGAADVEDASSGAEATSVAAPATSAFPLAKVLVIALAVAALAAILWPKHAGDGGPAGFLVDASGRPTPLAPRMPQVTLLHFWASWCPPCRPELPAVVRLADDLAGQRNFGVVMVAVADEPKASQQLAGTAATRVLYDPNWDVAHRYGTSQLPETYLIIDGKVKRKYIGAVDWDDAQIRAVLK